MRKFILAGAAALAIPAPAVARDNSPYVGVDLGILVPQDTDFDATVRTFTFVNTGSVGNAFTLNHKMGYDVDAVGGYDFGMFRVEGEVAYKRASVDRVNDFNPAFLTAIGSATGVPVAGTSLDVGGHVSVLSGMLNALGDFGGETGIGGYLGAGVGMSGVKYSGGGFSDRENTLTWQLLAGVYMPVSENIDVGLKYRYFHPGRMHLNGGELGYSGTGSQFSTTLDGRFVSHSLLLSLTYNFAAPPSPPPPSALPPPPPPGAPATQTCPDGSVILATDACPAPPPPPPPAPVERGERGQ